MKIEKKAVVWHDDLEELIKKVYGYDVDIQAGEYANGSYLEYDFLGKIGNYNPERMKDALQEVWDCYSKDENWIDIEPVLYDLIKNGHLPEDDYLITIWW